MKKVVLASLLTLATAAPTVSHSYAQAPAAQTPAASDVQMSQEEYAAYNNANTQTAPAAKAAAFEAYLKAYPNSAVKLDVLNQMLYAYAQAADQANTLATADRLLAVDPSNIRALTFEVYYRRADADKLTDAAAKTAALDKVAQYAQTAITTLNGSKPAKVPDAEWAQDKTALPTFESALADDALSKKDNAGAITALKAELAADPDDTTKPSPVLQDVYVLAQAYYTATPPDYLNCTWYATRAVTFAPDAYKPQIQPLATYCYTKYHGNKDGYDAMVELTKTNINPPATLATTVTPAPKPEDIVAKTVASTPDLATLAISDKEFMLQYGAATDPKTQTSYADEVFNTVKGKSTQFPGVTVMDGSTAAALKVAVTDDANATKTADFTFQMKEPLKEVPATGTKVDIEGTYASYTPSPLMITMSDGALTVKKAPAAHPAHRATTTHHTTH
jgi:hypothetical protein